MNRKEFFRKLGLASVVAVVAPRVLASKEEDSTPSKESLPKGTLIHTDGSVVTQDEVGRRWRRYWEQKNNEYLEAYYRLQDVVLNPSDKELYMITHTPWFESDNYEVMPLDASVNRGQRIVVDRKAITHFVRVKSI